MEAKITEDNKKVFAVSFKGIDVGLANALRRYAINSVKSFAIDTVTFYENSSAMFDEYIAHRIGLVPIKTPTKGYHEGDNVMFSLEAEGPKIVYSGELKSAEKDVSAMEGIPIIKLGKAQRLRIEGKAIMGNSQQHAKFQPGLVTYEEDGDTFKFYIESFGQMPPKEIIKRACDALTGDLKEAAKAAKKL